MEKKTTQKDTNGIKERALAIDPSSRVTAHGWTTALARKKRGKLRIFKGNLEKCKNRKNWPVSVEALKCGSVVRLL